MAQLSVNHVTYAFVVSDFDRQATTIVDPASSTYIKEGEVVVAGLNNQLITADANSYTGIDKVKIVQRKDSGLYQSPPIDYNNVTLYKVKAFVDKVDKVVYLGWNGTSNGLEDNTLVPGTEYIVKVRKLGLTDHYEDSYITHKLFSWYNASLTTGEHELARGLVKNGVDNFDNNIDGFVKIEMVTECATTAAGATVSFVRGSKLAVASSAGHNIQACDFIKVNGEATYYVESVDGVNIYLEVPYQDVDCTVTPQIVNDPTSGAWGLKFTGTEKVFDSGNNKFRYDVPDFEISLTNFNNSKITISQTASLGNGTWKEVAQLEWEVQDYEGQTSHTDWLMPTRKRYFEEGKEYDIMVLRAFDNSTGDIAGKPISPFTIFVAIPVGNTQGDDAGTATQAMGVVCALDTWLTSNTGRTYDECSNLT